MAINYLNSVDLNKNYINNAAIQNLATEPTADTPGQIYFNTTSQVLKVTVQTGTSPDTFAWEEVGGGIEGGGTINTIPKFTPGTDTIGDSSMTDDGTTVNFSGSLISLDNAANADAVISAPGKMFIELDNDGSGVDERFEIRTTVAGNKAARLSIDDDGNTSVLGTFIAGGDATIVGDLDLQEGTLELGGTDTRLIKGKDVPEIAGNTPGLSIETGFVYGTDTAGPNLTLSAGQSTGTGNGGGIVFQVSTPSGSSGSASNALATALTISGINGDAIFTNGIQVDSDSIMYGTLTMDNEVLMSNNKITGLLDPTTAQDAATKAYVDAATVGGLVYQGGYNAATNTPALDTNLTIGSSGTGGGEISGTFTATTTTGTGTGMTVYVETNATGNIIVARVVSGGVGYTTSSVVSVAGEISGHSGSYFNVQSIPVANIEKGWTYTVTDSGYFYNELVDPGDVLIAEVDGPALQTSWTIVQNNIELADTNKVGIGNSTASLATSRKGISVSYSNPTNGTAIVGLNIDGLTANDATDDPVTNYSVPFYNAPDDENYRITMAELALASNSVTNATGTIAAGDLVGTVTHAFGINTIVQTIDSSGNTVYCDVSRTETTSVATITAAQATDITILVQKIG